MKQVTHCRFGMLSWLLILVSYAAAQHARHGAVPDALLVAVGIRMVYLARFYWWETGCLRLLDIMHGRAGFYICSLPAVALLAAGCLGVPVPEHPPAPRASGVPDGTRAAWVVERHEYDGLNLNEHRRGVARDDRRAVGMGLSRARRGHLAVPRPWRMGFRGRWITSAPVYTRYELDAVLYGPGLRAWTWDGTDLAMLPSAPGACDAATALAGLRSMAQGWKMASRRGRPGSIWASGGGVEVLSDLLALVVERSPAEVVDTTGVLTGCGSDAAVLWKDVRWLADQVQPAGSAPSGAARLLACGDVGGCAHAALALVALGTEGLKAVREVVVDEGAPAGARLGATFALWIPSLGGPSPYRGPDAAWLRQSVREDMARLAKEERHPRIRALAQDATPAWGAASAAAPWPAGAAEPPETEAVREARQISDAVGQVYSLDPASRALGLATLARSGTASRDAMPLVLAWAVGASPKDLDSLVDTLAVTGTGDIPEDAAPGALRAARRAIERRDDVRALRVGLALATALGPRASELAPALGTLLAEAERAERGVRDDPEVEAAMADLRIAPSAVRAALAAVARSDADGTNAEEGPGRPLGRPAPRP